MSLYSVVELTPLCVKEDSRMNILSTRSCCCFRAISRVSTSKPNMIIKTILLGEFSSAPDRAVCPEHGGGVGDGGDREHEVLTAIIGSTAAADVSMESILCRPSSVGFIITD